MQAITEIEQLLNVAKAEMSTFNSKHTASSGTRARAALLKVKKQCDQARKDILAETKQNKTKKSMPAPTPEVSEVVEEAEEVAPMVAIKKPRKRKTKVVVE
jgi:hypothetical protein